MLDKQKFFSFCVAIFLCLLGVQSCKDIPLKSEHDASGHNAFVKCKLCEDIHSGKIKPTGRSSKEIGETTLADSASSTSPVKVTSTRTTISCSPGQCKKVTKQYDENGKVIKSTSSTSGNGLGSIPPPDSLTPSMNEYTTKKNFLSVAYTFTDDIVKKHHYDGKSLVTSLASKQLSMQAKDKGDLISKIHFVRHKADAKYDFKDKLFMFKAFFAIDYVKNKQNLNYTLTEKDCERVEANQLANGVIVEFEACNPEKNDYLDSFSGKMFILNSNINESEELKLAEDL